MKEHGNLAEAREALERITDYFDQRSDAEAVGDPARYQGNREMHLRRDAETVAAALAAARAEGAAEAYAEAAKVCDNASVIHFAERMGRCPEGDTALRLAGSIRALAEKERP